MERRTFLARIAVVSTPLVAGCSGGGDGSSPTDGDTPSPTDGPTPSPTEEPVEGSTPAPTEGPTPTPTASPSPEPTGSPSPEPTATAVPGAQEEFPDYDWSKLEGVDPVADASIRMRNSTFRPMVAAVAPGTELTVTNADSHGHTFTAPRLDVSERLSGGDDISVTVEETGTFDYVCTFHPPGMLGRLVVTESASTPASGSSPTPTPKSTSTPTETGTETTEEEDGYY